MRREWAPDEIAQATAAALAMLRAEFPRFRDEHDDFVQTALVDAMQTVRADSAFTKLVVIRARGCARKRAGQSITRVHRCC